MNEKARLTIKTKASGITRTGSVLKIDIDNAANGRDLTYLIAEDNVIKSGDDSVDAGTEEVAKRVEKLVALKKKQTKDTATNFFQISIKEIKRKDTAPESSELDNTINANAITLAKDAYVNGDFDISKNFDIFDHKRNAYDNPDEKYEAEVAKLDELETLLSTLKTDYATDLKTAANIQIDIDKLEKYKDTAAATPAGTEIERAIYDLDAWGGGKIYKSQVEQILKANANGFVLENTLRLLDNFAGTAVTRTITNLNDIKDGKYKGFDITEGAKVGAAADSTTFNPTNLNKNVRSREIFGKNAESDGTRYRVKINNFRFNNSSDKYFGHANYAEISDRKKLRGFQPGDIRANGTHTIHGTTGFNYGDDGTKVVVTTEYNDDKTPKTSDNTTSHADLTKKCFDILHLATDGTADNTDDIIRIAFTNNNFAELKHDNPTTDPTKYHDLLKKQILLLEKQKFKNTKPRAIMKRNDSPTGGFTKVAELEKAISDNNDNKNIKKIYEEFKKLSDSTTTKKTDSLFNALDALIKELRKTGPGGDTPKTWKSNLNADKVADTEIKKLTDAIKLAEDEIKKEGDAAVTAIAIKNQESIKLVNEIKKLFKLCQEAHEGLECDTVKDVKDNVKGLDKDDKSRLEAAVALKKETSDEGKLFYKIFSLESTSEYSDSEDKLDESLTDIKKHIEELEKLIKAKDTDTNTIGQIKKKLKEVESVDSDFKVDTVLSNWKSKLEARKTELQKKKDEKKDNTGGGNKPEKPWWKE
ncbi:96_t:CDS:2 [Paraglomus occultum]|uniref:96_t:CDS:1 n=1 Tax=Paraglomus occultum TaxID=144539 RepID=A0A9N9G979_9GLOM|nr:96_t:CDS:2 [Paraglomus occultum]